MKKIAEKFRRPSLKKISLLLLILAAVGIAIYFSTEYITVKQAKAKAIEQLKLVNKSQFKEAYGLSCADFKERTSARRFEAISKGALKNRAIIFTVGEKSGSSVQLRGAITTTKVSAPLSYTLRKEASGWCVSGIDITVKK